MTLTLYLPQKSYRNGIKGLPKPIGTMFFVTVAAVLQSGFRQNHLPVILAAVRMWSLFCVGNSQMAEHIQEIGSTLIFNHDAHCHNNNSPANHPSN
jgi:hypothetical protein